MGVTLIRSKRKQEKNHEKTVTPVYVNLFFCIQQCFYGSVDRHAFLGLRHNVVLRVKNPPPSAVIGLSILARWEKAFNGLAAWWICRMVSPTGYLRLPTPHPPA